MQVTKRRVEGPGGELAAILSRCLEVLERLEGNGGIKQRTSRGILVESLRCERTRRSIRQSMEALEEELRFRGTVEDAFRRSRKALNALVDCLVESEDPLLDWHRG